MKKLAGVITTLGMTLAVTTPALAFSLSDVNKAVNTLSGNQQQTQATTATTQPPATAEQQATLLGTTASNLNQASALVDTLTNQLGVTKQQAIGGSAALLAAAKSELGTTQFNQLSNQAPGIDGLLSSAQAVSSGGSLLSGLSGLSGNSNASSGSGTSAVGSAFKLLGMDSSMVGQFAPLMLQYFGTEGVSSGLLSSLASVWNTTVPTTTSQ